MKLDVVIAEQPKKTLYRDGDKCIKLFHKGFSKADILNEALNQARIEGIGINVPKLLEVVTIDGQWAIVSEFIEGKTMAQLMLDHPDKKQELLKQFVDIQLDILSHTCPLLNDLKVKMHRKIEEAKLNADVRYELHTRLNGTPNHKKVCHGDFNPTNIVIKNDGTPFILDWSHVTQGNASADAARTYLLFRLNGQDEDAKAYLDMFCESTDTAHQYVQRWMPIVAASQSVKGNEKERDFLMSWANVVEYQ